MHMADMTDPCSSIPPRTRAGEHGTPLFDHRPTLSKDERYYIFDASPSPLPRVSTILDHKPNPGIDAWKERVGKEEAALVSKTATDFGSRVHNLTEMMDRGYVLAVEPDLFPWSVAWRCFVEDKVDHFLYIECFLFSLKHGFAGTCDRVAVLKNGDVAIVDLKTSNWISDDYGLQTCAYYAAFYEMTGLRVQQRMAVYLPSKKSYKYGIDHFDDLADDWAELKRRRDSWYRARDKEDYWKRYLKLVDCKDRMVA